TVTEVPAGAEANVSSPSLRFSSSSAALISSPSARFFSKADLRASSRTRTPSSIFIDEMISSFSVWIALRRSWRVFRSTSFSLSLMSCSSQDLDERRWSQLGSNRITDCVSQDARSCETSFARLRNKLQLLGAHQHQLQLREGTPRGRVLGRSRLCLALGLVVRRSLLRNLHAGRRLL